MSTTPVLSPAISPRPTPSKPFAEVFWEKVESKQGAKTMLGKWTQLTEDRRHFLTNDKLAPGF